MKPITLMIALVSGLALSAPAYAGYAACEGMEGKDLKKCDKAEAKKAKADANSEPILPSQVDAHFSALDADNPFATDAYKVRFAATGIQGIDDALIGASIIKGKVVLARYMVDNFDAMDVATAKADGEKLVEMLSSIADDAAGIKAKIEGIIGDPGSVLSGPDLMKVPKLLPALKGAITNITDAVGQAPEIASSLGAKLGA